MLQDQMFKLQLVFFTILCVCSCYSLQETESEAPAKNTVLDNIHGDVKDYRDDINNEREVNISSLESTPKNSKIYFIKLKNNMSETNANTYKLKIEIDDKELTELKNNLRNVEDSKSSRISELEQQVFSLENENENLKEQVYKIENELNGFKLNFKGCVDRKMVATKVIIINGLFEQIVEDIKTGNWSKSVKLMKRHLDKSTQAYKQLNNISKYYYDTFPEELAERGYIELIQVMLDNGLPINKGNMQNITMLHKAAAHGQFKLVKFLIQRGADVNVRNSKGNTPLHLAAFKDAPGVVQLLIESGADINATNNVGSTPIHEAAGMGNLYVVKLLVMFGADINSIDNNGETPLHWAARWNCESVVQWLVDHGCNQYIRNNNGKTAKDLREIKHILGDHTETSNPDNVLVSTDLSNV